MLLRALELRNFRAVKSANISFDPTTVLIGENDCGRSSVMEALALALGWNSPEGGFPFQPFHFHRDSNRPDGHPPSISIALEFAESSPVESLPRALAGSRRFRLEVTQAPGAEVQWTFRAAGISLTGDRDLLAWLRRRIPVFWMAEGMMSGVRSDSTPGPGTRQALGELADEVTRQYRDLLQGTAVDISAAIEGGAAAARQLLLTGVRCSGDRSAPLAEVLEKVTGKRKSRPSTAQEQPLDNLGASGHKIALLLLVGALLRSGVGQAGTSVDSVTLIENPEAHLHPMTLATIWSVIERIGGQKIIATHSGTFLSGARLSSLRRLTRHEGVVTEWRVPDDALTADELRRYSYHLRSRRAGASFARCWLLVEGETEFWLMGEVARVCGFDFASEGVSCVEFAQCGLGALIKVARRLGIEWHLLADGDDAGQHYARAAGKFTNSGDVADRITLLEDADLEHCFWRHGYESVFRAAAYPPQSTTSSAARLRASAKTVIGRAIDRYSKPYLAVLLLDALIDRGPAGVPPVLRTAIETCVRLARGSP